jgi:hypothetical protein
MWAQPLFKRIGPAQSASADWAVDSVNWAHWSASLLTSWVHFWVYLAISVLDNLNLIFKIIPGNSKKLLKTLKNHRN